VEEGEHAEEVLPEVLPEREDDRRLGWHLAMGALRQQGLVDAALRPWLKAPLEALDPEIRAALRLGAFEALFGRAPRHAVVSQAVEVVVALGLGRARGLVNAVMRRVVMPEELAHEEAVSHPQWLYERWVERYGREATDAWCEANNTPPPLYVAGDERGDFLAAFDEAGIAHAPVELHGDVVPGLVRLDGVQGRIEALPGYEEGQFWVQDAASAWMTDLVPADATNVLDACAAPGGKAFRLAQRGAKVLAVDRSRYRLGRMGESLQRLGLNVRTLVHDWQQEPLQGEGPFDCVLLDAPCSALGTLRRNPEIKWRRGPFDPMQAAQAQSEILAAVWKLVAPGGSLVYVVCSPEPEEGLEQVQAFLASHEDASLEIERTTAPPTQGEDAFYGARIRRK